MVLDSLLDFFSSFVLGVLTPLTALCVLPLYPAFIAYLSGKVSQGKGSPLKFGLIVTSGVISFMFLMGLIFTTFLQTSLTNVIGIISPIAFSILAIVSILMIVGYDFSLVQFRAPTSKNPYLSAFAFGFFFGAIVVPCNPALIAAFFAKSVLSMGFYIGVGNFIFFGLGMAFPLLVLSVISQSASTNIFKFLGKHKRIINICAGIIMLAVSLYYLLFVFRILGDMI